MTINRHNYEEFFLLYVDNELTAEDRAAVDRFVQENTDLAEEMEMLKQAALPDESIAFEHKALLYQHSAGISLDNYEEYFLLSADRELTTQQHEEVEKFILKHPDLQPAYTLLQQSRLEPEVIVFEQKEKLYRKESKKKPVIWMHWMRISVAAAMIGLIAMIWFFAQNNPSSSANDTITGTDPLKKSSEITKPAVTLGLRDKTVATLHTKTPETPKKIKHLKTDLPKRENSTFAANTIKKQPRPVEQTTTIVDEAQDQQQKKKSFENAIASAKISNKNSSTVVNNEPVPATVATRQTLAQDANLVKHAVYREIDNETAEEEKSFYIGSAEINKNKLKGLLKKATSLFEKKNKNDDNERTIQIAGFEIKSK